MMIRNACSLALYCQRCGSIHVHGVPYFTGERETSLVCRSCGHEKARVERLPNGRIALWVRCVGCGATNRFVYALKYLRRIGLEKIYCARDHFELGYIGRRRRIAELMAFNQAEFEALHPEGGRHFVTRQRVLLEALNRLHDMARNGDIVCPCGSDDISADIRGSFIVLECNRCGSFHVLRAEDERDLSRLGRGFGIGLLQPPEHVQRT